MIGKVYGTRQDLKSGTMFRDCSFSGTSDERGAAIFANGARLRLFLVGCRFGPCWSAKAGGAICIETCLVLSMKRTQGERASAGQSGGFSYVGISRDRGWFEVSECWVSTSSATGGGILRFEATGTGAPATMQIESTNLTDNQAVGQGSAMWFAGAFNFIPIGHSILAGGSPANCLAFDGVGQSNLTSVSLLNNSCTSTGSWQGLIAVKDTTLNLINCVFKANTVSDFWLGFRTGTKMTFVDCVFDDLRLTRTGAGGIVLTLRCLEAHRPELRLPKAINANDGGPSPAGNSSNGFTPVGPKDWTRGQLYTILPLYIFLFHCELRPL